MKIGLIGLGNIEKVHLDAILNSGNELFSICDIDYDKINVIKYNLHLNAKLTKIIKIC